MQVTRAHERMIINMQSFHDTCNETLITPNQYHSTYAFGILQVTLAILDGRLPDAAALLVLFVMVVVMMMAMVMGVLIMLVGLLTIVVIERVLHRDATRPEKPTHHHQFCCISPKSSCSKNAPGNYLQLDSS